MGRLRSFTMMFVLLGALGGCSSGSAASSAPSAAPTSALTGSATTPSVTPTSEPSPAASASPAGGPGESATTTAVPTAVNPCTLLTDAQASKVNGITYGPGTRNTLEGGVVSCVWSSKSPPASVTVGVLVAPSATEADVAYVAAQAVAKGFQVTKLTGFADEAAIARAPSGVITAGGIYVRDGAAFFDVVYINGTAPSDSELKLAATLVLGALP